MEAHKVTERVRQVVDLYGLGLTQSEIARTLHMSKNRVHQIVHESKREAQPMPKTKFTFTRDDSSLSVGNDRMLADLLGAAAISEVEAEEIVEPVVMKLDVEIVFPVGSLPKPDVDYATSITKQIRHIVGSRREVNVTRVG